MEPRTLRNHELQFFISEGSEKCQMRPIKCGYEQESLNSKTLKSNESKREKSPRVINTPEPNLPVKEPAKCLFARKFSSNRKESSRTIFISNLIKKKGFKQNLCDKDLSFEGNCYERTEDELDPSVSKVLKLDFNESNRQYTKSHKLYRKPKVEDENNFNNKTLQEIDDLRHKGKLALKNKDYELAIQFYTKGFSIEPESNKYKSLLYSDAGYAHMLMDNHPDAIEYFEKAISLDENNSEAKRYKILCLIKSQEFDEAENETNELLLTNNSKEVKKLMKKVWKRKADYYKEEGDINHSEIDYMIALKSLTSLINSDETDGLLMKRAEVFIKLDLLSEATADVEKIINNDPKNADAKRMQIKLSTLSNAPIQQVIDQIMELYTIDESDSVIQLLKNNYVKKGLAHMDQSEFQEAMESYNNAIIYAPHDISLYEMRAKIAEQLNDCLTIIIDTSHAIEMGSTDTDNWVLRARCLLKEKLYKEAYEDALFAYNKTLCPKIAMLVREAEEGMLRNSTETFYDILGVEFGASNKDIKERYSKLSLEYHPDVWSRANEYFRNAFQEKFKKILQSYKTLINPALKQMYDVSIFGS